MLIQRDSGNGPVVSNYRPIACLPLMWKLLTGIFSEKIYELFESNGLPVEQKGCRENTRGTKDQLIGDKACREIEVVCTDQHESYSASVKEYCPKAVVVFDRFHLVQNFNEALNNE